MSNVANGQAEMQVKVWRPQGFAGVEVETATGVSGSFNVPQLLMPTYELGVHIGGGGRVRMSYAGKHYRFDTTFEQTVFTQHAGETVSVDATFETPLAGALLRFTPSQMGALQATFGLSDAPIYFPDMLPPNSLHAPLSRLIADTVGSFDEPTDHLEREVKLLGLVYAVLKHCADTPPPERKLGQEHKAVSLVKEALHAHPEQSHKLDDLAELVKLNKIYLLKVFKRDVGVTPDQYHLNLRVHLAKDALARGQAIAETAYALGFFDQSHLNRVFKKYTQVTPGRFQRDTLET